MLVGDRIYLKLVEEADLSRIVAWRNTPSIWVNFFNKFPLSLAKQKEWFERLLEDSTRMLFMICSTEENKSLGTIGLDHIDFSNQTAEYGNILIGDQESAGKGYASEATRIILTYCFLRLNINKVYLKVLTENIKAIELYEKNGFVREGVLRDEHFDEGRFKDVVMMSILRKEYFSDSLNSNCNGKNG